jgi:biotin transport system substrate-specific component
VNQVAAQQWHLPIVWAICSRRSVSQLALAAVGACLLALSAKVQILSWPVPMTMQTYVILVIGMAYGTRLGIATVLVYLAAGAAGLPVFAGTPEKGIGVAYMAGPTGGYLLGFVVAAWACGRLAARGWDRGFGTCLVAMTIGHLFILGTGVAWLAALIGWSSAVKLGLVPFIAATVLKTLLAAATLPAAWQLVARVRGT